jgi:hypothetical protein
MIARTINGLDHHLLIFQQLVPGDFNPMDFEAWDLADETWVSLPVT